MSSNKNKFDLEDRLIDFAVRIIRITESMPKTKTGTHISNQLLRSGTSPAPNYGEAQSAERMTLHSLLRNSKLLVRYSIFSLTQYSH